MLQYPVRNLLQIKCIKSAKNFNSVVLMGLWNVSGLPASSLERMIELGLDPVYPSSEGYSTMATCKDPHTLYSFTVGTYDYQSKLMKSSKWTTILLLFPLYS